METTEQKKPVERNQPYQTASCKVVCYYSHYGDGTPRPYDQIKTGRNRTSHPMYSSFLTKNAEWYTDHRQMVKKALLHVQKHEHKIISAVVYLVNHKQKKEYDIGKFVNGKGWEFWYEQVYSTPDHKGNVYISEVKYKSEHNFLD